jgi:hypothetical protein
MSLTRVALGLAVAMATALLATAVALAHEGNPNYRSQIRAISPQIEGLSVRILDFDDRMQIVNRTGETVVIQGYRGEPYVRVQADGTVELNRNSPAMFLNEDRFGKAEVPSGATEGATPNWEVRDRTGSYEWHDHRIHWMSEGRPPQVTNPDARTKVFDWKIPVEVGSQTATISGDLFWVPVSGGGVPIAAIIGLVALALAIGAGAFLVLRRGRRDTAPAAAPPVKEAW